MYEPRRFPLIPFVIVSIVVLAGIGIFILASQYLSAKPEFEPEASAITQAATPTATLLPTPTLQPTSTPLTLSTETIVPDLRFGVVLRDDGCVAFNEIVVTHLAALDVQVETVVFDDSESLYENLAEKAVDLTVCFQDPTDRPFLTEHVGFLKTIDAPYFDNGEIRLQVMMNAANIVPLREERPCLVRFLRAMNFEEPVEWTDDVSKSAETWLANNQTEILKWSECS